MTKRTTHSARRRQRWGDRGASAVEFAIVLPVLLLFLYGIIEFGTVFLIKHGLTEAAADAVRAAATAPPATASTMALNEASSAVSGDVGGLIGTACSQSATAALQCTASVTQCPNQPTGYSCLTVQLTYRYGKDSKPVLPDLLNLAPTLSASATVLLTGGLT